MNSLMWVLGAKSLPMQEQEVLLTTQGPMPRNAIIKMYSIGNIWEKNYLSSSNPYNLEEDDLTINLLASRDCISVHFGRVG